MKLVWSCDVVPSARQEKHQFRCNRIASQHRSLLPNRQIAIPDWKRRYISVAEVRSGVVHLGNKNLVSQFRVQSSEGFDFRF